MAEPVRTCVGCRRRLPQADLRRFVLRAGAYVADDPRRRGPGRGAYLCSAACIDRLRKNRRYPGLATAASLDERPQAASLDERPQAASTWRE